IRIIQMEPLFRPQDSNVSARGQVHLYGSLNFPLECIFVVSIDTSIEELRSDLHNRLSFPRNSSADLKHLSRCLISSSSARVWSNEGCPSTEVKRFSIRQMKSPARRFKEESIQRCERTREEHGQKRRKERNLNCYY